MTSITNVARRSIPERSIRILVSPTPTTFAERRSILQVLEQYGPVEFFKMTPGYQSNFISLTKEASTATKLVECSPLTYQVPTQRINTNVHVADLDDTESLHGFKLDRPSMTAASDSDQPAPVTKDGLALHDEPHRQEERQFKLEIFPAPDYNHKFTMLGSPLHQSWPEAYRKDKSFLAATLKQSLPQTMASSGLAHWLFDVGSKASQSERKAERLQLKGWMPSKMKG